LLFMLPPFVFFERFIWIASRATQMPPIRKAANSLISPKSRWNRLKNRSVKITCHESKCERGWRVDWTDLRTGRHFRCGQV